MNEQATRRQFLATAGAGATLGTLAAMGADSPAPPVPGFDTKALTDGAPPPEVCCTAAPTVIFACSGSADVGKIADRAARKLTDDGVGKMSCLAGVGGRVPKLMEITKAATTILVIDGCPLQCGKNTLEHAGFKKYEHLCLADVGMAKGQTPATDAAVAKVARLGKGKLEKSKAKKKGE